MSPLSPSSGDSEALSPSDHFEGEGAFGWAESMKPHKRLWLDMISSDRSTAMTPMVMKVTVVGVLVSLKGLETGLVIIEELIVKFTGSKITRLVTKI